MVMPLNFLTGLEPARRRKFERAINVAGAGTVLIQTFINRVVQQIHDRNLGAITTMPRRAGSGNAAYINRRTPGSAAQWVDDVTEPAEGTGSYNQVSLLFKTLIVRGLVTRKMMRTGATYSDVLANEIIWRTDDMSETLEITIFQGDTNADANSFDGLITTIQATASQIVLQTTNPNGDALGLEKLDEAIDQVKGSAMRSDMAIYVSEKGQRLLDAQLQAAQQFVNEVEIEAGFRVTTYHGIPIIVTDGIPDDSVFDGATITGITGAVGAAQTTSIVIVNTRYTWLEELTPLTVMPLANKSSQYDEFDIFWDGVLVPANELGQAILIGIDAS